MRIFIIPLVFISALVASAKDATFSLRSIDATLSKIADHAQDFPPRFSSVEERKQIEAELRDALTMLDAAVAQYPDNPDILFRDGFANAMGHNLDFEGCAEKYFKAFDRLLEAKPDDKRANFYYGGFLAATAARQKDSIRYLEKAVSLGVTDAHYTLAFVYLSQADTTRAVRHLKEYSKAHPEDEGIKKKIAEIGSPDFHVVRQEGLPPGFDEMTKKTEANPARGTAGEAPAPSAEPETRRH